MPQTGASSRPQAAWAAATAMLARRDLSEGEVRSKLLDRDFAASEVEDTVSRLRERRYLDDPSLAAAVARRQADRRRGPFQVRAHLNRRLFPEALAREAVRAAFPEGREVEQARETLRRMDGAASGAADPEERRKTAARLLRRLVGRGFSREAARRALLDVHPVLDENGREEVSP